MVDHGDAGAGASCGSSRRADGSMIFSEELVALTDVTTTQIATGLIGILNNPRWVYERGERDVRFDDRTLSVPALSGKPLPVAAASASRSTACSSSKAASLYSCTTPAPPPPTAAAPPTGCI